MNAEQLLAHYEKIADAPEAVPRLRRFILDLAVRGKLVPQDPNDEPASELLRQIAAEKARIGRKEQTQNKRRKENSFDSREIALPVGWAAAPLADLVTVLNGRAYKKTELLETGTPVLRVGNLFTSDKWYYSSLELDDDKYCEEGDLIFAWSASFGPFIWSGPRVIYHYHIWKLPLHSEDNLDKLYLYNFLLQKTREIKDAGHGISMIHMTKEKMERLFVPLPPLSEQRRIVAKLNELMALCDRLEVARAQREAARDWLTAASLARLNRPDPDEQTFHDDASFALNNLTAVTTRPDQIKQLRQTILNLAVRGKLVPQNPNNEPASELLRRIAAEKARLSRGESNRTLNRSKKELVESLSFDLNDSWAPVTLRDILIELQTGPFGSSLHQSDYQVGGTPVVNPASIQNERLIAIEKMAVDVDTLERLSRFKLRVNDIVMGRRGEMGRCAVVTKREEGWLCGTGSLVIRLSRHVYPRFLVMLIGSPYAREYLGGSAVGATMQNLNQTILLNLSFGLPPLPEQHRIVAKVDELMAMCDRLEANLEASAATRRSLLDALLHAALRPETRKREAA